MVTEDGLSGHLEDELPDYLNDLNAMHEAEKTMTYNQSWDYYARLSDMVEYQSNGVIICEWAWHATASQRADAFLLATGRATV